METLIATVLGAVTGAGAAKVNPLIDGGWWLNLIAGAAGGLVGARLLGGSLESWLADSSLASAGVSGAIGGAVLAVGAGALRRAASRRRV